MQLELRQPVKKYTTAAFLFLAAAYLFLITLQYLAAYFFSRPSETHLVLAARLDPGNAEYRYSVGRFELLAHQSPQNALPWLQAATRLNPNPARYWLDLAITHQLLGEGDPEVKALQRALAAEPHSAGIAWQSANLYLAQGSPEAALRQYRIVMENDPSLAPQAIKISWKIRPDIDFLLDTAVPPNAYGAFLEFLCSKHEPAAAAKAWEKMVALHQPLDRALLFGYVRDLIAQRDAEQAALVWQQAADLSGLGSYQPSPENLLVNGDFSLEILNNGFDWMHQKIRGVALALDPSQSHSSSRSLRITFDGPGIEDAGIRQSVPVEPKTNYEFSAFYKAQGMDGAGGAKFAVQDLYSQTSFFLSEDLQDADFWKKINGSFTTGSDTRLLVVRIARIPAGSPIRGKLWIDGLKLVPVSAPSGEKEIQ